MLRLKPFAQFIACERGVTSIEYGMIASIMAIALIPALSLTSGDLTGLYIVIAELWERY